MSPASRAGLVKKVMITLIIDESWNLFDDQNIEHKINKHPVMTVINGNDIQLGGMSEESMNTRHVDGVACLHTCVHTHAHVPGFPSDL